MTVPKYYKYSSGLLLPRRDLIIKILYWTCDDDIICELDSNNQSLILDNIFLVNFQLFDEKTSNNKDYFIMNPLLRDNNPFSIYNTIMNEDSPWLIEGNSYNIEYYQNLLLFASQN